MLLQKLKAFLSKFGRSKTVVNLVFPEKWSKYLTQKVSFYKRLNSNDKGLFEQRVLLFLQTTQVESGNASPSDEDKLLVAASAIIPVWSFQDWHYFNLKAVYLLPASFNQNFQVGMADSTITGMVGTGPMSGKMVLSQPALHQGFSNERDKQNVGIHEFVHLIDMMDGKCDGYPERLRMHQYSIPWFDLVHKKIKEITKRKSNIRQYGATNAAEFLSVTSEYFFERPQMLKKKHPILFSALSEIYQQDVSNIKQDIKIRKKDPCFCGSGKRYKRCCMQSI